MDTTIQCLSHEGVASKRTLPPYCRATPSSGVMSHLWGIQTVATQQSKAHLDVKPCWAKMARSAVAKRPQLKRVEEAQGSWSLLPWAFSTLFRRGPFCNSTPFHAEHVHRQPLAKTLDIQTAFGHFECWKLTIRQHSSNSGLERVALMCAFVLVDPYSICVCIRCSEPTKPQKREQEQSTVFPGSSINEKNEYDG